MICRLCLEGIAEVINIFDAVGIELSVAEVLAKYFWFKPQRDDPISTAICNTCWIAVSNFHEFYMKVEEAHRLLTERFSLKDEKNNIEELLPSVEEITLSNKKNLSRFEPVGELNLDDWEDLMDCNEMKIRLDSLSDVVEIVDNKAVSHHDIEVGPPILRRSTRSSVKGNTDGIDKTTMQEGKCSLPVTSAGIIPSLPRRGRPPKKCLENTPDINEKLRQKDTKESQEISMAVDEKIAKHMKLTCDICMLEYPTFLQLRRHYEKAHNRKGYAVCCSKKFFKRVLLAEHIDKHINPDCFRCKECDKVFADKQCMRNHFLIKHQPDDLKTFECDHCGKKFAKSYLLEQHRIVHGARTHICDMCQKGFPTPSQLLSHTNMIHGNYGTMCDICAKVIRGRTAFARHQLEHKGVTLPKVQCDKCGSWHKDKYSLQKHKRRHNDEGSMHVCNICNKIAPNRSALLSHQRYVHMSQRSFECGVCSKAFKKAIILKEHMAIHTGEVLYKCLHCPKTFNSNANMHSHRKKVHPKEFEEARKTRLEHKINPDPTKSTVAEARDAAESVTKFLTIQTVEEGEALDIVLTTGGFTEDEVDGDQANSIIFTVH